MVTKKRPQQRGKQAIDPAEQMRRMVEQSDWARRIADTVAEADAGSRNKADVATAS